MSRLPSCATNLAVQHRLVSRPSYAPTDRLVLATLAGLLSRERWSAFLVNTGDLVALASGTRSGYRISVILGNNKSRAPQR
jgi:hypothetical protein